MEVVKLIREDDRARLVFAREDKPVNVLDEACLSQLEAHLDALEAEPPKVLVLESGVEGCFIAGADIEVIARVDDAEAARRLAERGQAVCRRIEALPAVSVALVDGVCMGGGLEIALACDRIIAVESERTMLALPEIKLGIHPGFGGCVRLPARVGWLTAVDMILSGKRLDARRAAKLRLADLSAKRGQESPAVDWAADRGKRARKAVFPWWMRLWPVRRLFFAQVRKRAMARFRHLDVEVAYPAVPATIDLLESIVGLPDGQAMALEAESLGRLAVTPTCKNLIRVFRLGEALKHQPAARRGREAVRAMRKAAIYGAGVMGSGIAWVASKRLDVDLHEVSDTAMARGLKSLARLAKRDQRRGERRLARIRPALDHSGLAEADVVIEAVLEEPAVKNSLWKEVEARARKDALLLTNTSSLEQAAALLATGSAFGALQAVFDSEVSQMIAGKLREYVPVAERDRKS
ncbi:MAG: enoyl-CoA hydratase-related protein, partial [Mariprofundaceae bacterium]